MAGRAQYREYGICGPWNECYGASTLMDMQSMDMQSPAMPKSMPKSILIVDDSATVRDVIRFFLEGQEDLSVCGEAVDGVDAIEKAKALQPDLILLDLAMPRMNGVEAASVLKGMMPKVPIILFTMYNEALGQSLASAVGVSMVVSKPDGMGKLVQCVQSLLKSPEELPRN
jgi:DNA-binding NarL/FixJ family response regulator